MKTRLHIVAAIALVAATPAAAHRLDEYLQATLITIEKDQVRAEIRLVPGVAVFPIVLEGIDTDGDGTISETERRAYAERMLRDLSLTIDGDRLRPRLVSAKFPSIAEMREGMGEIQLELTADLPRNGGNRRLVFENHHQNRIAAYLVNCLAPSDPDIRIVAQSRNYTQSFYQLNYAQAGIRTGAWSDGPGFLVAVALLLFVRLVLLWRVRAMPNVQFRIGDVNWRAGD